MEEEKINRVIENVKYVEKVELCNTVTM